MDPKLSRLDYYGGPTQTFAPLPGSPAIGSGNTSNTSATDQRGLAPQRRQGGHRRFQTQPLMVNTTADPVVAKDSPDSAATPFGQLSLRQAIVLANVRPGSDTITFDPTVYSTAQTITLAGRALRYPTPAASRPFRGPAHLLTIDGHQASGVFTVGLGAGECG